MNTSFVMSLFQYHITRRHMMNCRRVLDCTICHTAYLYNSIYQTLCTLRLMEVNRFFLFFLTNTNTLFFYSLKRLYVDPSKIRQVFYCSDISLASKQMGIDYNETLPWFCFSDWFRCFFVVVVALHFFLFIQYILIWSQFCLVFSIVCLSHFIAANYCQVNGNFTGLVFFILALYACHIAL